MSLSPDSPLSLDQAAKLCLNGLVKASTLRAAISRGELRAEFTGKRYIVTPADIEQWREICRDKAKARVSILGRQGGTIQEMSLRTPAGSSETEAARSAQAAAQAKLEMLRKSFKHTSRGSTRQNEGSAA